MAFCKKEPTKKILTQCLSTIEKAKNGLNANPIKCLGMFSPDLHFALTPDTMNVLHSGHTNLDTFVLVLSHVHLEVVDGNQIL